MSSPVSRRLFVRIADGTEYVQLLTITAIATVLLVRGFLELTDYPQIGSKSLHIAHVLWGGLAMVCALVLALLFVGRGARIWTAMLGGIGLGLFVDEIGKFVTSTNDYFYRPAASIIYVTFALLVLMTSLINRDKLTDKPERIVNASLIATVGLASGLTPQRRAEALEALKGRDDDQGRAMRHLLGTIPDYTHSSYYDRFVAPVFAFFSSAARRRLITTTVLVAFAISAVVFSVIYVTKSIALLSGNEVEGVVERQAIYAIAASNTLSAILGTIGAFLLLVKHKLALRLFQFAILVNLLFGQIFNFTDSQFSAVVGLPFNLIAFAVVTYEMRHART